MYAVFTHVYLVPFEILIFFILLALFMLLAGGRIANRVLSRKEFYEPLSVPDFDTSEEILDEAKFLLLGLYDYIYDLFFTNHYVLFCYLDRWYAGIAGINIISILTLKKRLMKEDEEIQLLKNNLAKLATYNRNNFHISYNDVEEIVFRKNGFRMKLLSENQLTRNKKLTFLMTFNKFANQEKADILALFKKYFPERVKEEKGRFLDI